jgi:glycerol kinase
MSNGLILAIDQGTTNTKALAVDGDGRVQASASVPMPVSYPEPGWAEQSAETIWQTVQAVIAEVAEQVGGDVDAVAISNQRETIVVWDADTGQPLAPAIIWQCRRSAERCAALVAAGRGPQIEDATGLGVDPLFPAAKLGWLLDNIDAVRNAASTRRLRAGTVDSWLLWNLSGGSVHATDHSNASRTQLFNTRSLHWDDELGRIFNVPLDILPRVLRSDSRFGETEAGTTALPGGVPIHAMMGDSHAALFGHGIRAPGTVKATYGTGSSLMTLTPARLASRHGLSSTIAWSNADGPAYALEGNISVSGQAAAFMAELLQLSDVAELAALAQSVANSNGVTFVPALVGLGAPHWAPEARGLIGGLTLGVKPAHLARAAIDAIALQIADVFEAMEQDLGEPLLALSVDGGASRNDQLMQLQADLLERRVARGERAEVSAIGAAMMAGAGLKRPLPAQPSATTSFTPRMSPSERQSMRARWHDAVRRATGTDTSSLTSKAPDHRNRIKGEIA